MGQERDRRVLRRDHKRRPDRLLAEELVHDPVLDPLHQPLAEPADHGGVDPGGHQAEGVAGGDEAVVRLQVFEPAADDADAGQAGEPEPEGVAHRLLGVNQPHALNHEMPTQNE